MISLKKIIMQHQLYIQRNSRNIYTFKSCNHLDCIPRNYLALITKPLNSRLQMGSPGQILFQCSRKRQRCPSLVNPVFGFAGHTPAFQFMNMLSISGLKAYLSCRALQPCQLGKERTDGTDFLAGYEQDSIKLTSLKIQMKQPN